MKKPNWQEAVLEATERYHCTAFIDNDPIQIPHLFTQRTDIEVAGFFAALFSWGNRTTIISKARDLMRRMDNAPGDFVRSSTQREWASVQGFVHRTFQDTDLLFLIDFLHRHYSQYSSLEDAFLKRAESMAGESAAGQAAVGQAKVGQAATGQATVGQAAAGEFDGRQRLQAFHERVFAVDWSPARTRKHVPSPDRGSRCKRLNMFLRWMVRRDSLGVDFGLWQRISPASLMMPVDVHVERVALQWGLLTGKERGWHAVEALTAQMRLLDPEDPVRFDYGLFSLGVEQKAIQLHPTKSPDRR